MALDERTLPGLGISAILSTGAYFLALSPADFPGKLIILVVLWASAVGIFGHTWISSLEPRIRGRVALDIGASTGGFTDVLLQSGAARVYAVDVGTNQLAWKLRQDPRVVVMEQTNIRYLEALPEQAHLATADVSYIGLELVTPAAIRLTTPDAFFVFLIK